MPASMVVSWTLRRLKASTRAILERGAPGQGQPKWWRAGRGAVPPRRKRSKGRDVDANKQTNKQTKDHAQPSDRPKWRRAGARACQRSNEKRIR